MGQKKKISRRKDLQTVFENRPLFRSNFSIPA
jgi:hypothetical protein